MKYLPYILVVVLTIILILVFYPRNKQGELTRKQTKSITKENKAIRKQYTENKDSIELLRQLYLKEAHKAYNTETSIIYIKQKTNEEVNRIPYLPVDSNISQFTSELEQYLHKR